MVTVVTEMAGSPTALEPVGSGTDSCGWGLKARFILVGLQPFKAPASVCHRDGVAGMATGTNLLTQPTHHGPFYDGFASLFLGTFQATL